MPRESKTCHVSMRSGITLRNVALTKSIFFRTLWKCNAIAAAEPVQLILIICGENHGRARVGKKCVLLPPWYVSVCEAVRYTTDTWGMTQRRRGEDPQETK